MEWYKMPKPLNKVVPNLDIILGWILLILPISLSIWVGFNRDDTGTHAADYATYVTAGEIVRSGQGHRLYDIELQKDVFFRVTQNKYPVFLAWMHHPVEALIYLPSTLFDYETGLFLMRLLNSGILCTLVIWIAIRIGANAGYLFLLWLCLLLGVRSFAYAIQSGQDSIWILFLIVWGLVAAFEKRQWLSAILLGIASIKFTVVFPLLAILLLCRFHKIAAYSLCITLILILVPCLILGPGVLTSYFALCQTLISVEGQLGLYPSLLRNLRGILYHLLPMLFDYALVISGILGFIYAIACRRLSRRLVLPFALFGATFFSMHVLQHDTVLYIGCLLVYLVISRQESRRVGI
jgi:hypothetical protein